MSAIGDLHKRLPQGDVWIDAHGRALRVASMNRRHAANAVAFLERNAEHLHDAECYKLMTLPLPHGDSAQDVFDDEANRLFDTKPLDWLNEQPLMIALRERAGDHRGGSSLSWRLKRLFSRGQQNELGD